MIRQRIIDAATAVLIRDGLEGWTIERVATQAGCAKGLVHYHHGTKRELLGVVAQRLSSHRLDERCHALERSGASGLDALWDVLARSATSGATAAWASLVGYLGQAGVELGGGDDDLSMFAERVARSLALGTMPRHEARALLAALDGLEVALLARPDSDAVHEAYHTLWLWVLRT